MEMRIDILRNNTKECIELLQQWMNADTEEDNTLLIDSTKELIEKSNSIIYI